MIPLQAYSFRCWFSNNPIVTQTHLWQKLAFSSPFCYSNDISSTISFGGIVTLLFSLTISIREDRVLFLLIHLTGVLRHLFKFFFILSSLASLFNRSAVRICSSLFLVYLVSTRMVSIPSCPLYSSFIGLQPPRFTWCSLFLFSTTVLSIVFNSVVFFLSTFQPLKVLWFHSLVEEAT